MIKYPFTKKTSCKEELFGNKISDPYRWLENIENEEVKNWIAAQNTLTDDQISRLPEKEKFKKRLLELLDLNGMKPDIKRAGEKLFYLKKNKGQTQYSLYRSNEEMTDEKIIFDPNAENALCSIDSFEPSPSGKSVAYVTSLDGSEIGTVTVLSIHDNKIIEDGIKWSRYSSIVWNNDETGFYFSKLTQDGLNEKIYFHKIGVSKDVLIFGDDFPDSAIMGVYPSLDREFLIASVIVKWDRNDIFIAKFEGETAKFYPLITGYNGTFSVNVNKGAVFIETNLGAPNKKIYAAPVPDFKNGEKIVLEDKTRSYIIIREGKTAIENFSLTENYIIVNYTENVRTRLKVFDIEGEYMYEIALPADGVGNVTPADRGDLVYIEFSSFFHPQTIFSFDIETNEKKIVFEVDAALTPQDFRMEQIFYGSKDETIVPMYILSAARSGEKGGPKLPVPAILTGYGGFNHSRLPAFSVFAIAWIESGGIFAEANLRGGGEYGETWHTAGKREKKQNVFDDFIYAAKYLIDNNYTTSKKLAVYGRSNGGLLIGAAITQAPELFGAAVCGVPLLDMLRFDKFLIGKYWVDEYGEPSREEEFKYIYKYSPYHHVKAVKYPPVYTFTALSDARVHPMHAFKMTAKLQEAAITSANGNQALLRIEMQAGHGAGKPVDLIAESYAEQLAFIYANVL
ncbi:MAG TPA: prolyl oligopeptidase family serine peptidase [Candidatus Wallbacteria bacterium]|nr:prolyl oligopeptidase family serine peptidase [Candidatus Wallbacteria bacterium]